ncbi:hypothetical protein BKA80DRAFT_346157, partial [Phyllosticta citrichinensis]
AYESFTPQTLRLSLPHPYSLLPRTFTRPTKNHSLKNAFSKKTPPSGELRPQRQ